MLLSSLRLRALAVVVLPVLLPCPDATAQGEQPPANRTAKENLVFRCQEPDGRWDADGFGRHDRPDAPPVDGAGDPRRDLRVTALVLLACLGDGSTVDAGPNREQVRRGFDWLIAQQDERGRLGTGDAPADLEDHAIATLALAHAFTLSGDRGLRGPAQRAIDHLELNGDPKASGFTPALAAWRVLVRQAVRPAGAGDPGGRMRLRCDPARDLHLEMWLDRRRDGTRDERKDTGVAAAAELLVRVLLAAGRKSDERTEQLVQRFVGAGLALGDPEHTPDSRVTFFVTHALYHLGGRDWAAWSKQLTTLVRAQRTDGNFRGSFDPPDAPWSRASGRIGCTALGIIVLEDYYRYSRLVR